MKLLLIEDDGDDALIFRELLEDSGHTDVDVEWVDSVEAGWEAVARAHYDICFVDHRLGQLTGLDFLQRLPAIDGAPPTIVLSGSTDLGPAALKAGAVAVLSKQELDPERLTELLRKARPKR